MDQRIAGLERVVSSLEDTVRRLERRVALLEGSAGTAPAPLPETSEAAVEVAVPSATHGALVALRSTPALVGRSLLVLAGGFFLRALTEAGTLAPRTGVALGLAYAGAWVAVAAADAHRGRHGSAGFYAACAALIGNPLLFEAVTSFGVMSETTAAVALALMTAVGLAVAVHWKMHIAAWVFGAGALATAVALAMARPPGEAATAVVVGVGLAWLWVEDRRGWNVLTWLTALAANVAVLRLTALAVITHDLPARVRDCPPLGGGVAAGRPGDRICRRVGPARDAWQTSAARIRHRTDGCSMAHRMGRWVEARWRAGMGDRDSFGLLSRCSGGRLYRGVCRRR